MILRILSLVLLVIGAFVVYGAKLINKYIELDKKVKGPKDFEFENEEDRAKYLEQKAMATIKVFGLIFVIPGIILAFIAFK